MKVHKGWRWITLASAFCFIGVAQAQNYPGGDIEVLSSPRGGIEARILRELDHATRSVDVSAYSFTNTAIEKALERAVERSVTVRVLVDKSWQNQSPRVVELIRAFDEGVHAPVVLRVDQRHSIAHTKEIIIDGRLVFSGSYNFTRQAERSNREREFIIHNSTVAVECTRDFNKHWEHGVSAQ